MTAATAAKPSKRKRVRVRTRTEELDVAVQASGPHEDLLGQPGILFLDYRGTNLFRATFEPSSALPNAILPVKGFLRSDSRIMVRDDEGVSWQFEVLDDEEDEPEVDCDPEHPFNCDDGE